MDPNETDSESFNYEYHSADDLDEVALMQENGWELVPGQGLDDDGQENEEGYEMRRRIPDGNDDDDDDEGEDDPSSATPFTATIPAPDGESKELEIESKEKAHARFKEQDPYTALPPAKPKLWSFSDRQSVTREGPTQAHINRLAAGSELPIYPTGNPRVQVWTRSEAPVPTEMRQSYRSDAVLVRTHHVPDARAGSYVFTVVTGTNAAGRIARASARISVGEVPSDVTEPAPELPITLAFDSAPTPGTVDAVTFYLGDRLPAPAIP